MLKQYEEVAVLEQGDDGAIVSIRGQEGPSVLLGAEYLGHLGHVASKAKEQLVALHAGPNVSSIRLLCLEMETLLRTFDEACNKFHGKPSGPKAFAAALEELNELRLQLEAL